MDAYQIRTKSTDGANPKKRRGDSVVRSCSGALKGMVLSIDGSFVGSTHGANETQHENRLDLEITQSLNQTLGRSINFHHALHKVSWVQSNDESNHQGQSWFQHIWRVEQSVFHGTLGNSPRSMSSENHALRCHTNPNSICNDLN